MKARVVALGVALVFVSGCSESVDLNDDDDFQSYRDGYVWLSDWEGDQKCDNALVDDWKDLTGDDYDTNEAAFLLGCNDFLDGKLPRK